MAVRIVLVDRRSQCHARHTRWLALGGARRCRRVTLCPVICLGDQVACARWASHPLSLAPTNCISIEMMRYRHWRLSRLCPPRAPYPLTDTIPVTPPSSPMTGWPLLPSLARCSWPRTPDRAYGSDLQCVPGARRAVLAGGSQPAQAFHLLLYVWRMHVYCDTGGHGAESETADSETTDSRRIAPKYTRSQYTISTNEVSSARPSLRATAYSTQTTDHGVRLRNNQVPRYAIVAAEYEKGLRYDPQALPIPDAASLSPSS